MDSLTWDISTRRIEISLIFKQVVNGLFFFACFYISLSNDLFVIILILQLPYLLD